MVQTSFKEAKLFCNESRVYASKKILQNVDHSSKNDSFLDIWEVFIFMALNE